MIILQLAMDDQCQLMITVSSRQSAYTVVLLWESLSLEWNVPFVANLFCNLSANGNSF